MRPRFDLFIVLLFVASLAVAEEKDAKTHTVARRPFKVEVKLPGVIESLQTTEVSVAPQSWASLLVLEAVAPGTRVTRGQTLFRLETDKIDEAIRDLEAARALTLLTIQQEDLDLKLLKQSGPLDLELAERTQKEAALDLDRYVKLEGPLGEKAARFKLKGAQETVEYVGEELRQLEKMYKANDLVEETEEIVLKRARNDLEQAKFALELAQSQSEEALQVGLPRELQKHRDTARQSALAWEKARTTQPIAIEKQRLELEKLEFERKKAEDQLTRLKADRQLLTVLAPADGVVYYGRASQGKWITAAEAMTKLRPGGVIQPREVMMTIVRTDSVFVRASVPEKDLSDVTRGVTAQVAPTALPHTRLPATLQDVSPVPTADGQFDARFSLSVVPHGQVVPGMSCEVRLAPVAKADAIAVPTKAVFSDDLDENRKYVLIAEKNKPDARHEVTVGRANDSHTEILTGLQAGDQIKLEKPE